MSDTDSAEPVQAGPIPPTATTLPQEDEAPEASPFYMSFIKYKKKECQIDGMTLENSQAALHVMRDVGVHFTNKTNFLSNTSHTEIKPIKRDGEYKDLYRGLYEDEEVHEIKFIHEKKKQDVRMFFSLLEKEKIFFVIAVRGTHYDTSKGSWQKKHKK
ncbi:MAG: hypothetical protein UX71_C0002G0220 [Parcubacteria group bacterium GW2011_GWA1_47_10]|uniref:Uncharacterized protein n=1 Tax=Candidatus Zambryskibacteria bacterium RIFCSPHIGHO2_01_FULL_46_25 TaxID=1802738 RepID=A0A1G2SYF0_9BACT|nr:MAG: hypothetical protein UX71_C0002G0220 [Parcubacteria group bacterium GW2011_GWA1_47_10]OHA90067.1 MAG: hypothetical protein A2838_00305 [Candidatus Zambryskibacteria bacterium RIFCSPHIGHO2_01_FULL_46_25]OHB06558.1 MAG: hypothetical protein A3A31_02950 [Candidatus Zambryskibacteria bacterium RIFCSPLOWO2_01_FULL_48_25]